MKPVDKAPGGGRPGKRGKPGASACTMCGKPVVNAYRPFCSRRCADLDLGRWLKGAYAVPGEPDDAGDERPDEQ